jgi:hypothetical protein
VSASDMDERRDRPKSEKSRRKIRKRRSTCACRTKPAVVADAIGVCDDDGPRARGWVRARSHHTCLDEPTFKELHLCFAASAFFFVLRSV